MSKRSIKLRFQNGLTFGDFKKEVFDIGDLNTLYHFEESPEPDFVIFGPYGNDLPPRGNYTRIGYFCENIKPDLSICEWAFGVPREEDIAHSRYTRIQWHGLNPQLLIKHPGYDPEKIAASKTRFCNFLYSHRVPYREAFFSRLSRYKKIDAPGRSMNNMPGIDSGCTGDKWEIKKQFLSQYKFTIAFENDIYPGYQTEKLYDAMIAGSIPIYCGDPFIGEVFNTKSFVNVTDNLPQNDSWLGKRMQKMGQMDFEDIRPAFLKTAKHRLKRKIKANIRGFNNKVQVAGTDFGQAIAQIIALDTRPELYLQYLRQPWLNNNAIPETSRSEKRWIEIFSTAK